MSDENTPSKDGKGRFVSGNIGGGRHKGSRNKLGEQFIADLYEDWQEHGVATLASILPKDLNVNINHMDDLTDEQLIQRIRSLDSAIRPFLDAQGAREPVDGTGSETTH
jgi:hypothetical protein